MKIGILHYSLPPVIGGVERVIAAHARLFQEDGHEVVLLGDSSRERTLDGRRLSSDLCDETRQAARETRGLPTPEIQTEIFPGFSNDGNFEESTEAIYHFIVQLKLDVLIVHNIFTMPFCLAATAACHRLAKSSLPIISWVHDLAAINPDYQVPTTGPHALLHRHPPGAQVVAVSEQRASAYRSLTGFSEVRVIPNGIDFGQELAEKLFCGRADLAGQVRSAFPVLFHPTRILRRKNIALGIHVIAHLKSNRLNPLLILSGAPEGLTGHQSTYRAELDQLTVELGVQEHVVFLHDSGAVSNSDIGESYQIADALFFPSDQEGFGLPILEAGLRRTPIFASNIQPLASLVEQNGFTFPVGIDPADLAQRITDFLSINPASHVRQAVRRDFDWQTIYSRSILPLLESLSQ